jgi:hypothetical protein
LVVAVVCITFAFSLTALAGMHLMLSCNDTTTNEDLRSRFDRNPYSTGGWSNLTRVLCGPRLPSRLLARHPLEDGRPINRPLRPVVQKV